MKQEISIEQYAELPEKQQLSFLEWMEKQGFSHLATIALLIAFLEEKLTKEMGIRKSKRYNFWQVMTNINEYTDRELCDALWEAVKDVLKNS